MCCGNGGPWDKSSNFQTSSADSFRRKFSSARARPNMLVAAVAAVEVAAVAQNYCLLSYYVPRISSTLILVYFKFVVSVPWTKARNLVAPASSTYRAKTEREREREYTQTHTHTERQRDRQTDRDKIPGCYGGSGGGKEASRGRGAVMLSNMNKGLWDVRV